jgi:hypothetical protein
MSFTSMLVTMWSSLYHFNERLYTEGSQTVFASYLLEQPNKCLDPMEEKKNLENISSLIFNDLII